MNMRKAEELTNQVLLCFQEFTHQKMETPVYVLSREEINVRRRQIINDVGAQYEMFGNSTMGESVSGPKGSAIILYPFNIFSTYEYEHTLLHECGHMYLRIVNSEIADKQLRKRLSLEANLGFTMFDEFFAEVMAFAIANTDPASDPESRRREMVQILFQSMPGTNPDMSDEAIAGQKYFASGIYLIPAGIGRYVAMMLADPDIQYLMEHKPQFDRGFGYIGKNCADILQNIIIECVDYINTPKPLATVNEEFLTSVGKKLRMMWEIRDKLHSQMVKASQNQI